MHQPLCSAPTPTLLPSGPLQQFTWSCYTRRQTTSRLDDHIPRALCTFTETRAGGLPGRSSTQRWPPSSSAGTAADSPMRALMLQKAASDKCWPKKELNQQRQLLLCPSAPELLALIVDACSRCANEQLQRERLLALGARWPADMCL